VRSRHGENFLRRQRTQPLRRTKVREKVEKEKKLCECLRLTWLRLVGGKEKPAARGDWGKITDYRQW